MAVVLAGNGEQRTNFATRPQFQRWDLISTRVRNGRDVATRSSSGESETRQKRKGIVSIIGTRTGVRTPQPVTPRTAPPRQAQAGHRRTWFHLFADAC
jgi:hypothetical protein